MSLSIVEKVAELTDDERASFFREAPPEILHAIVHREWRVVGRPEQLLPAGDDWWAWMLEGGRGSGKTRAAAEGVVELVEQLTPLVDGGAVRVALVGGVLEDVRATMVEGVSGLRRFIPPEWLLDGSWERSWNRGPCELNLATGAQFKGFSSAEPGKLRGPEHHVVWIDEVAKLKDAAAGPAEDSTWSNAMLGLRAMPRSCLVLSTTPKRNALMLAIHRDVATAAWAAFLGWVTGRPAGGSRIVYTRMRTDENIANLSDAFKANVVDRYRGTRLGRQELDAEMLDEVEGALWSPANIDPHRVPTHPKLIWIVTGVDPQGEHKPKTAETGIITVGAALHDDGRGHLYVLDDSSLSATPEGWGAQAAAAYHRLDANQLVGEVNNGGDMVRAVVHAQDPTVLFDSVRATRGKAMRAEPIVSLYQQGRVHHVGYFPDLEDQMLTWEPESGLSPDRVDALVWAATQLLPRITSRPVEIGVPSALGRAGVPTPGMAWMTPGNGAASGNPLRG